jgi:hypothetical protein
MVPMGCQGFFVTFNGSVVTGDNDRSTALEPESPEGPLTV